MNYQLQYDKLIAKARDAGRRKLSARHADYVCYHSHHIVPKCMLGSNKRSNKVLLTKREHRVAHRLLVRVFPKVRGLKGAVLLLTDKDLVSETAYAEAVKLQSLIATEVQNKLVEKGRHNFQKPEVQQNRKQAIEALVAEGRLYFQTEEGRKLSSKMAAEGLLFAQTDAGKQILSAVMSLTMSQTVICPHCCFEGKRSVLQNTHFDFCTQNPDKSAIAAKSARSKEIQWKLSQKVHTCTICCLTGKGVAMTRYHFDNCKLLKCVGDFCNWPRHDLKCPDCGLLCKSKAGLSKHRNKYCKQK